METATGVAPAVNELVLPPTQAPPALPYARRRSHAKPTLPVAVVIQRLLIVPVAVPALKFDAVKVIGSFASQSNIASAPTTRPLRNS